MQSLKELFKIGNGPSSSHTMGPKRAVDIFKNKYSNADKFEIYLYGSLALTGIGHLTDRIIRETLKNYKVNIIFDTNFKCDVHPNTFDIFAYKSNKEIGFWRVYSIGGGTIRVDGEEAITAPAIYKLNKFDNIKEYCIGKNISLVDFVYEVEGIEIREYIREIWDVMQKSIKIGLNSEDIIPGKLQLKRKAKYLYNKDIENETCDFKQNRIINSYAYAVSEENASGGVIVTSPTCGASGVVPAVLYYLKEDIGYDDEQIIDGLIVAGLIGNLIKKNASISGAECGCQAEVGSACSMAAAAYAYIKGLNIVQIESAAEIAMEHHLGLTCDPIYGYVQIPCIERNGVAAMRAIQASNLGELLSGESKISFDMVIETMYETGKDLNSHYRETSEGGLAKKYCRNKYFNTEM